MLAGIAPASATHRVNRCAASWLGWVAARQDLHWGVPDLRAICRARSEQQITDYWSLLRALPIRGESQSLWANVDLQSLARRQNIAAYDAAYLDLASRTGLALATSDEPFRQAAIAQGITVLS